MRKLFGLLVLCVGLCALSLLLQAAQDSKDKKREPDKRGQRPTTTSSPSAQRQQGQNRGNRSPATTLGSRSADNNAELAPPDKPPTRPPDGLTWQA